MKTYIPKQPKHTRERVEAKLDARLVRQLERYCEYWESDRDYVLSQALELIFRKDKGFAEWLESKGAASASGRLDLQPEGTGQDSPERVPNRARVGGSL